MRITAPERHQAKRRRPKKNRGGKPLAIDDLRLQHYRDCWIAFLSEVWGEIGWPLQRARAPQDVRQAFAMVTDHAAGELRQLITPFVHETNIEVTGGDVSRTRAAVKSAHSREYALQFDGMTRRGEALNARMRESREALRIAARTNDPRREHIQREHRARVAALSTFNRQSKEIRQECVDLERQLAEQEAAFAQAQVCAFVRAGKYAHTPERIGRAMAGLPAIGTWQSYRRCTELATPPIWPTPQWRIFTIIDGAWEQRADRSARAMLDSIAQRVRQIRTRDRRGQPDHLEDYVQQYFSENWWYVVQTVEETTSTVINPHEVPYVMLRSLAARIRNATQTERVLADAERLPLEAEKRRNRRPKRR